MAAEAVPGFLELLTYLLEVVNLTVIDNPQLAEGVDIGMCPAELRSRMDRRQLPRPTPSPI
jgi:hypothetical protein